MITQTNTLVDALERATAARRRHQTLIEGVSAELKRFLPRPDLVPAEFQTPIEERYARYLLYRGSRFIVVSVVWKPGQASSVHDHGTWGVMGVWRNEIRITNYRRMDDRSRPGYADLAVQDVVTAPQGSTAYVLPPREEIHKVENVSDHLSVSVHVYGREMKYANRYDPVQRSVERFRLWYTNPS